MAIFPTYGGVSTSIATQRTPDMPEDPRPKQLAQLGAATERTAGVFADVMKKRQSLDDEADAMQRYMSADAEMSEFMESLRKPDIGYDARENYAKALDEGRAKWYKGLSPGATARLEEKLAPKMLEYRRAAGKIEHGVHLDRYQATGVQANTRFAEMASRIVDETDGASTKEYDDLKKFYETGVANGYYTAEEAEKATQQALIAGATSRVLKVSVSTDKKEIENALKIADREDMTHDTFWRHIPAPQRVEMRRVLMSRMEHLNSEEQRKKNQERIDTDRMNTELSKSTEIMAVQKLQDPAKYGPLTHEWLDQAGEVGLIDGKDLHMWHTRLEENRRSGALTSGGFGDASLINRLETSVRTTKTQAEAAAVQAEVLAGIRDGKIPVGPGKPGTVMLSHLEPLVRGSQDETLTPYKQMVLAKQEIDKKIQVSGPMAVGDAKQRESFVAGEAYEMLNANAMAGFPKTSAEILEENMGRWQAQVGAPAKISARQQRLALGIPVQTDLKMASESTQAYAVKLAQQYQAAPPGPEGDAVRAEIDRKATELKRLVDLEDAMRAYEGTVSQARAGGQPKAQPSGKPMQGPRRP